MLGMLRRCRKTKGAGRLILVIVMAGLLSACDSPSPAPASGGVLSVRLEDGAAWLGGYPRGTQLEREQNLNLNWNQTIWAGEDGAATLLIAEHDLLSLDAGSGFRLIAPAPPNQLPTLRLLEGSLGYQAASERYALGTHFEVPAEMRILVADLIVAPATSGSKLEMVVEDNVTTVTVQEGEIAARGNGVTATLFAGWRAVVRPGEPMEVIPPRPPDTPTPTVTLTPTPTPTSVVTPTPINTPTSTLTSTTELDATPTLTSTLTPTPTVTASPTSRPRLLPTRTPTPTETPVPTQPPPPPPPPSPRPTKRPSPTATRPPPTATPPPPPTATPSPPPTNTVRPTAGGS